MFCDVHCEGHTNSDQAREEVFLVDIDQFQTLPLFLVGPHWCYRGVFFYVIWCNCAETYKASVTQWIGVLQLMLQATQGAKIDWRIKREEWI